MEKSVFNLKSFRKVAFQEGAKAQIHSQTRCMMNCYKTNLVAGMGAQKAWFSCIEEYNKKRGASDWYTKYASNKEDEK